jgi:microcin C transport system ATP-binding protein
VVRALANDVIVMRSRQGGRAGRTRIRFSISRPPIYTKALMAAAFNLEAADGGAVSE